MARSPRLTTNLPPDDRTLVGRQEDLRTVSALVDAHRLVTVWGPGGMGKTRLARAVAAERVQSFSAHRGGGVWFCDLSDALSERETVAAVAAAMKLRLSDSNDGSAALGRALALLGPVLVVLDNFDRLIPHAQGTVGRWLTLAPGARFLTTSRTALGLPDEQRWPLGPLSETEALELFARVARQVAPAFDVDAHRPAIAEVVETIDRMPLAIELAARRVDTLSAQQLLARLRQPLEVLKGEAHSERHRSVKRAIEYSVELLDENERRLFAATSVFRSPFMLEAAEAVFVGLCPKQDVHATLERLVRASLVTVVHGGPVSRYRLYETIRDVAKAHAELLGLMTPLAPALARWAAGRAGALHSSDLPLETEDLLYGHEQAISLAAASRDVHFAQAAATIARGVASGLFSTARGKVAVAMLDDSAAALDATGPHPDALRAELDLARGLAHREYGAPHVAREAFERGLQRALGAEEPVLIATALTRLGEMSDVEGDTEAARARFSQALSHLDGAPEGRSRAATEAEVQLRLGHALRREGKLDAARSSILRAVELYRSVQDDEGLSWAMYERAVLALFDEAEDALACFDEGLKVALRGDVRVAAGALTTARGCVLQDLSRLTEAAEHHAEAVRVFRDAGIRYREASALYYLATTFLERGEPAEALTILRQAQERSSTTGAARYSALINGCMAAARAALGDHDGARDAMQSAEAALAMVKNEPALAANVRALKLHVELTHRGGDRKTAVAEATTLVSQHSTDDSRFALRVLSQSVAKKPGAECLVVQADGAAFVLPNGETRTLPARSPLRHILRHLAQKRVEAQAQVVAIDEVVAVGWPGEKMGTEAGLNRAYVALASLRKLGLKGMLLRTGGGYALSEAVLVRIANKVH
jgi:predicted ATPase